jgi:hypothetical protein
MEMTGERYQILKSVLEAGGLRNFPTDDAADLAREMVAAGMLEVCQGLLLATAHGCRAFNGYQLRYQMAMETTRAPARSPGAGRRVMTPAQRILRALEREGDQRAARAVAADARQRAGSYTTRRACR